jgi:hypothetical protein
MPDRSRKRPRDTNQFAKSIVDAATSEDTPEEDTRDEISKAAAALGRRGGLKGGKARAKKLSRERRIEIARIAAEVRWGNKPKETDK